MGGLTISHKTLSAILHSSGENLRKDSSEIHFSMDIFKKQSENPSEVFKIQ